MFNLDLCDIKPLREELCKLALILEFNFYLWDEQFKKLVQQLIIIIDANQTR